MPRAVGGNRGAIIVQVGPRRAETPGDRTGNRGKINLSRKLGLALGIPIPWSECPRRDAGRAGAKSVANPRPRSDSPWPALQLVRAPRGTSEVSRRFTKGRARSMTPLLALTAMQRHLG